MATKILKSKTIKERKPDLKLCPNHYHVVSTASTRTWPSWTKGTARRDGRGWYK